MIDLCLSKRSWAKKALLPLWDLEKTMRHRHTLYIAGILLGTTFGQTTSASSTRPPPSQPVILMVAVDPTDNVLVLTGNNFGNTLPTVYLRNEALDVKSFSSNRVVANLPSGKEHR